MPNRQAGEQRVHLPAGPLYGPVGAVAVGVSQHITATAVMNISEAVRENVTCKMWPVAALDIEPTYEESMSEGEITPRPRKKQLKAGKLRTAKSAVIHMFTWPHELVYSALGLPTIYDNISIPLFVSGCLTVMDAKRPPVMPLMAQHLLELMMDAEMYGWERVRAFHAVWLQQLKHGHVTWVDEDVKIKFQHTLV